MSSIDTIIKGEKVEVIIKTRRDIGFWQYILLGILSLFIERPNNYFIVTDKRVLLYINNKIKVDFNYINFDKIKINTKKDTLSFLTKENELKVISLSEMNLEYDDYQILKHKFGS